LPRFAWVSAVRSASKPVTFTRAPAIWHRRRGTLDLVERVLRELALGALRRIYMRVLRPMIG
jgi:hypothetical protein